MANVPIEEAGRLWATGRPLEAGRALTALVPPAERPRWAGRVLAWAYTRSRIPPAAEVETLITALRQRVTPAEAVALRDGVAAVLGREEQSGRFDSLREAVLTLALNAARLLVAATAPDESDPKIGWWFVASLKCVSDELDEAFGAEAWEVLRQLE
jgi:hypothetical protein